MKKINGITYLKALLPLLVVSCHIRPFGQSSAMGNNFSGIPDLKDIFYANISALAVPLFLIISFYLYLLKRQKGDMSPKTLLKNRIFYFLKIFVVCEIFAAVFGYLVVWRKERGFITNIYHLLFAGGDTLFYYLQITVYLLVVLELFYIITEKYGVSRNKSAVIGIFLSCMILVICSLKIMPYSLKTEALRFFSPIGFLPYVFVASLIFEYKDTIKNSCLLIVLSVGIILSLLEWYYLPSKDFLENGYALMVPFYQKLSVVFVSAAAFSAALKIKKKPSKIIEYLSNISLYVYCTHQFVIILLSKINIVPFLKYLLVLTVSYILSIIIYSGVRYIKLKAKKINS